MSWRRPLFLIAWSDGEEREEGTGTATPRRDEPTDTFPTTSQKKDHRHDHDDCQRHHARVARG